jgi:hypothetical protein
MVEGLCKLAQMKDILLQLPYRRTFLSDWMIFENGPRSIKVDIQRSIVYHIKTAEFIYRRQPYINLGFRTPDDTVTAPYKHTNHYNARRLLRRFLA